MLNIILSDDKPRSKSLSVLLIFIMISLAILPFVLPTETALSTGKKIAYYAVLAASFDMLLGYTAVLSFAHAMFFGIGAYFVAISFEKYDTSWSTFLIATISGLGAAGILALVVGLFSLRVRAIFFALVTLAFAVGFESMVNKLSFVEFDQTFTRADLPQLKEDKPLLANKVANLLDEDNTKESVTVAVQIPFTHGEEGLGNNTIKTFENTHKVFKTKAKAFKTDDYIEDMYNGELKPLKKYVKKFNFSGKYVSYYMMVIFAIVMFLIMLRIVNSPFGRVLKALRENEFRASAIGYKVVIYRTTAVVITALIATLTGCFFALSNEYVSPITTLSIPVMVNILLMVVIGGTGTMYGAIIGATIMALAENYLAKLLDPFAVWLNDHGMSFIAPLFEQNWYMWLGILFIVVVYFFPNGVVGKLRNEGGAASGH